MPESALTAEHVNEVFARCLAASEDGAILAEGVVRTAAFSPAALEEHTSEIQSMLAGLPDQFRKSAGGGWSFLNACMDRDGSQWTGLHKTMEELFMLGMATGKVQLLLPREKWDILPGGMPYYVVDVTDA